MIIYRLLRDLSPDSYCLISRGENESTEEYSRKLPGRHYPLRPGPRIPRGARFGTEYLNVLLGLLARARSIARVLGLERCGAVVACSGDPFDLPASYIASRMAGVPFYAYYFDYYSSQLFDPHASVLARRAEPVFLKGAAGVIVPNEMQGDALRDRYGVETTLIRNPCDISDYEALPDEAGPVADGEIKITYTGAVSPAHYDAFRNLLEALRLIGRPDVRLHLYTAQTPSELAREGIAGPVVVHGHQPLAAVPGIQRRADLLFLPLAFDSPYPELVRTAATTKLGEYLASRRPMLVHAPADSFVAWYCQRNNCGPVVGRSDPALLAEAVSRFLADPDAWGAAGAGNWERARAEFSIEAAQSRFAGLLGLERPQ